MDSFDLFWRLPFEVQDLIWEFYLLSPLWPIAHFARLELDSFQTLLPNGNLGFYRDAVCAYRSVPPSGFRHAYAGLDRRSTLLQTTFRSRLRALSFPSNLIPTPPPQTSALLRNDMNSPLRVPSVRIDTSTDLIILEDGFLKEEKRRFSSYGPRIETTNADFRYVAIWFNPDCERGFQSLLNSVHNLVGTYGPSDTIRVLYVLIAPDLVIASEDQPWKERMSPVFSLEEYVATYTKSQRWPGPFRCGTREYFEIPVEQITRLGGKLLSGLITLFGSAAPRDMDPVEKQQAIDRGEIDETYEPRRHRLMTWRDL